MKEAFSQVAIDGYHKIPRLQPSPAGLASWSHLKREGGRDGGRERGREGWREKEKERARGSGTSLMQTPWGVVI